MTNKVPVFVHFFDWFNPQQWESRSFVDPIDWDKIGLKLRDCSLEEFYLKQFAYIKSLGIDAIAWEYHVRSGLPPNYPCPTALSALAKVGLKIAPFYDLEFCAKVRSGDDKWMATLSESKYITPTPDVMDTMVGELRLFFDAVAPSLLARDKTGSEVIYCFGYGFDDSDTSSETWSAFARRMVDGIKSDKVKNPKYYWTTINSIPLEYLFLHHHDHFVPFHFALDTPQSQYGHDSVTWNFGFDNLGVAQRDPLLRVVKLDRRYLSEMSWLAGNANPNAIFIYGWNEPFEGSMLAPTAEWSDTKSMLAKQYIARLRTTNSSELPRTLIIVDDLTTPHVNVAYDWHIQLQRELLHYSMRRFAPQAELVMAHNVTSDMLSTYEAVVDISTYKSPLLGELLLAQTACRKLVFDSLAHQRRSALPLYFGDPTPLGIVNRAVRLVNRTDQEIFIRDEALTFVSLRADTRVLLTAMIPSSICVAHSGVKADMELPIILQRDNVIYVNCYSDSEWVLKEAFEALYQRPAQRSIMFGEGNRSQRLEIAHGTGEISHNTLTRYSMIGHWELPPGIAWNVPPQGVPEEELSFVFGEKS